MQAIWVRIMSSTTRLSPSSDAPPDALTFARADERVLVVTEYRDGRVAGVDVGRALGRDARDPITVLDEMREPRGEDVLRDSEAFLEVAETARAEEGIAHHEQRPPVAQLFQRLGDAAVHVPKALACHPPSLAQNQLHVATNLG